MLKTLVTLFSTLRLATATKTDLLFEIAALRQQLDVFQRRTTRPRLSRSDRLFWVWLSRNWAQWKSALVIVQPETVLRWHRAGYRAYWRAFSKGNPGRPRIPRAHVSFIQRISAENPSWGEDKIALELKLKLGVEHSTSTIRRYMVQTGPVYSSTWRTFLHNHLSETYALDFKTQILWNYTVVYILVIIAHDTRRVVHFNVTTSPRLDWVKKQIREACPWTGPRFLIHDNAMAPMMPAPMTWTGPRFLIHDNDGIFGQYGNRRREKGRNHRCVLDGWLDRMMGIKGLPIPYGVPVANAMCERFIGTLKRECLDHFIFRSENHLQRVVREYVTYYNQDRPHQGIEQIPEPANRPMPVEGGRLVGRPILGGLHHDYRLAA